MRLDTIPKESDVFGWINDSPIYRAVHLERVAAHLNHDHPDSPSMERRTFDDPAWLPVLVEEVGEVARALCDLRHSSTPDRDALAAQLLLEVTQVAAVACAWADAVLADVQVPS